MPETDFQLVSAMLIVSVDSGDSDVFVLEIWGVCCSQLGLTRKVGKQSGTTV